MLEACAAGIPVVATDVGGTGEVVENGVNGYLVKSGDPDALATRILDLTRSPELRRTMGGYGRARVTSHFSFTRQCASYRALFDSLLPRAAKRHEDDVDVPQSSVPGIAG